MSEQNFLSSAETTQDKAFIPPSKSQNLQNSQPLQETGYEYINLMIARKLVTAIVKKQKIEFSIIHFGEFNRDWLICEVESLFGDGDPLLIVVSKKTPITVYIK